MRENATRQAADADKCKDPTQWVLKNLEEIDDGTSTGNWTTRGYANSRIANSLTGHLADWSTRGLDNSRTSQLADWTSHGLDLSLIHI